MGHLAGLGDCILAFGDNTERLCGWDGRPLPKGRRRWCSLECADQWGLQHYWTLARPAAIVRDQERCVACGRSPYDPAAQIALLRWWCRAPHTWWWDAAVAEYREVCAPRVAPDRVDRVAAAMVWLALQDEPWWRDWRASHLLEVNHIEPRRGRGYQAGCHNHQSNLESLCRKCHVAVTRLQRRGLHGPAVALLGRRIAMQPDVGRRNGRLPRYS